jgi:predicted MFS family arabinose efflux permease
MLITAFTGSTVAVLAGVAVFGAGFGIAQNATLSLMYARVQASGYGTVSALWNLAYDGGMGVGALGFGALAAPVGYPAAFTVTGVLMLVALVPASGTCVPPPLGNEGERSRPAGNEGRHRVTAVPP